jgi:hypothetical protein
MQVVANLILDAVIAGVATALSGALVLPTLAGDEVRGSIAATLRGLGQSISGCAVRAVPCSVFNCLCVQAMRKLVSAFEAVSLSHSIKLLWFNVKTYGQLE